MRTGAVNPETVTCRPAKNVLSENASRGITVAKNEDFVRRVGFHFELHRAKALGREQILSNLEEEIEPRVLVRAKHSGTTSANI